MTLLEVTSGWMAVGIQQAMTGEVSHLLQEGCRLLVVVDRLKDWYQGQRCSMSLRLLAVGTGGNLDQRHQVVMGDVVLKAQSAIVAGFERS